MHIVDPTRSTGRRDSLLNGRKMWIDFRVLENPSSRRNGFALESPLTFIFIFKWGKPRKKNPNDSSMEKSGLRKLDFWVRGSDYLSGRYFI